MSDDRIGITTTDLWPADAEEDEGVVINWFVREGSTVEEGDTLGEIQIEKVSIDVVAPAAGTVAELAVAEDGAFERGDTLVYITPE